MIDVVQPYITTHPHGIVERHDANLPFFVRWAVRGVFASNASAVLWGRWPSNDERKAAAGRNFAAALPSNINDPLAWSSEAVDLLKRSSGEWWAPFVEGSAVAKQVGDTKGWPPANGGGGRRGRGRRTLHGDETTSLDGDYDLFRANFSRGDEYAAIVKAFSGPGEYFVVATASVDAFMLHQNKPAPPNTPPQSNFVNARLNRDYYVRAYDEVAHEDHVIRGRNAWHSKPVRVVVA